MTDHDEHGPTLESLSKGIRAAGKMRHESVSGREVQGEGQIRGAQAKQIMAGIRRKQSARRQYKKLD